MDSLLDILNQPIVGSIMMVGAVLLGYAITSKRLKKRELDDKRTIPDCENFRRRIGGEVDGITEEISVLKRALIFLVSKAGGNPSELGLMKGK